MIRNIAETKEELKQILIGGYPSLFLGAGFSYGAINKLNASGGKGLQGQIIETLYSGIDLSEDDKKELEAFDLRKLCDDVVSSVPDGGKKLRDFLTEGYKNTKPAPFHMQLIKYPWKKIFTVNIDDLIENIYKKSGIDLTVQNKKIAKVQESDTVLYKLHGCVNNPTDGFIFSDTEYIRQVTNDLDFKFNEFAEEIINNDVIFIGAKMDEPDIKSYFDRYENAGYIRSNKVVIILPKPDRHAISFAKSMGALLIDATAEDFLNFIASLEYNPTKIDASRISLNYNGIFQLRDVEKTYISPYDSKIYEGWYSNWQDAKEKWLFEEGNFQNACGELLDKVARTDNNFCFCIIGEIFSGKSCLLKQLGYSLIQKGFDVLEHHGNAFDEKSLVDYIHSSTNVKFAIVIDDGSKYYEKIEKLLKYKFYNSKQLVILTAARYYYHRKRKYYLDGNEYYEYEMNSLFKRSDAEAIVEKLTEKSHLSYLATKNRTAQLTSVLKSKNLVNLLFGLTYGNIHQSPLEYYKKEYLSLSPEEKCFLLELTIFDAADIEYYPKELFVARYGKSMDLSQMIDIKESSIVDFVKFNHKGFHTRNAVLNPFVMDLERKNIANAVIDITKKIAVKVNEKKKDDWYNIFQSLLKEDVLRKKFDLDDEQINRIYLEIKEQYKSISYYWLQFGLFKQSQNDYTGAFNDLYESIAIRPDSYQIQHAIARNYLRFANYKGSLEEAAPLFQEGASKMRAIIENTNYAFEKAKPFSVHSYVSETIKYLRKFSVKPSQEELRYLTALMESLRDTQDPYIQRLFKDVYEYLKEIDKLSMLHISFDSPYIQCMYKSSTGNEMEYME